MSSGGRPSERSQGALSLIRRCPSCEEALPVRYVRRVSRNSAHLDRKYKCPICDHRLQPREAGLRAVIVGCTNIAIPTVLTLLTRDLRSISEHVAVFAIVLLSCNLVIAPFVEYVTVRFESVRPATLRREPLHRAHLL